MTSDATEERRTADMTAMIVSAYIRKHRITPDELPIVITDVHAALVNAAAKAAEPVERRSTPAVPIKRSVTPDHIVCLEDGKTFKALKRHLRAVHNMTPDEYRTKWHLPPNYPMVAPNYSDARAEFARKIGFGRKPSPGRRGLIGRMLRST